MAFALSIEKRKAEKTRLLLVEKGLLDKTKQLKKSKDRILFPLKEKPSKKQERELTKAIGSITITKAFFEKSKMKPRSLEEALKGVLSKNEFKELITSFDVIGRIALILVPDKLLSKEKLIGKALLESNPQVKTVARILGGHRGEFRLRPVKVIAGKKTLKTMHKEWECSFRVRVGKVFFSPRLSHERARISSLIKKSETVCVFFAGVGPFPIVFAKHSKAKKIYAIELNPVAFSLMKENIELNKCSDKIKAFKGDVKKVVPVKLREKCDRIIMPLPKGSENFLKEAFLALKPNGGIIHFYQFVEKTDLYSKPIKALKETAKKFNRKTKILSKKIVRSFSPSKVQVVIDALVF